VRLVGPSALARGVAYSVEPCDAHLEVLGDEERFRQLVLNLVTNAVKFTEAGGSVVVSCDDDDSWVRISVRDSGQGIARDKHDAIFDPFVQVDRRLNRAREGVGLAISRDLARAMGGDLTVVSEPGQGSTFTLSLPRAGGGGQPRLRCWKTQGPGADAPGPC
jgi:signal transduction histidine kinase